MGFPQKTMNGFTLAELLICVLILGELATFTIPKIITSQTNGRNNAIAKETMGTMAGAYQQLQHNSSSVSLTATSTDLTQYMNYTSVYNTGLIDNYAGNGGGTISCVSNSCLKLHNGGILLLSTSPFSTTAGYLYVVLDPDGTVTTKGDSINILIFYNGRIIQYGDMFGSTYTPTWFSY